MRLALDCANYTAVPSPAQLDCLKTAGYARAIIGCSYGSVADMQLAAYYAAGFEVDAYAWVSFGASWSTPLDRALIVIARRPAVRRLWLDVEEEVAGMSPPQYEARIQAAVAYVRDKRPDLTLGIYTGRWWWEKNLPRCTRYRDLPLFAAQYVSDPAAAPAGTPTMFGGWERAALWQYAGSTETCGLNIDRCVILEDAMTPEELARLENVERQALSARADLNALANAQDAVTQHNDVRAETPKLSLKGLWYIAGKAWPF